MFNKTFVSLYFLKSAVLFIELDAHRKKVLRYATLALPEGLIENNKVVNVKALSLLIKGFWTKFGSREKTVGIVIPEFSTFTKPLSLPKLSAGELNEAVLWQAQEYLPVAPENMIIDWKIIERKENGVEVLMVAVPKEILMNYVEACEIAGLFPSAVQIPSVCLSNLIKESDGSSLILYRRKDEAILIYTQKEKLLGTSVLMDSTDKEIIDTAVKIVGHFSQKDFKNLYVGGSQISDTLLKSLKDVFKVEISFLKPQLQGIDEPDLEDMLIPISMQMSALTEPSDPLTLNLLPSGLVEKYRVEKIKIQFWSLTLTMTLFVWVSFIMVMGSYLIISQQIADLTLKNSSEASVSQTRKQYQKEAEQINSTANKILKIKNNTISPEVVLNQVWGQKPPGVQITIYKMDFQKGYMVLSGTSLDRSSLVTFEKNLETVPGVTQVMIPISSFEKETNLSFQVSFQYGTKAPTPVVGKGAVIPN